MTSLNNFKMADRQVDEPVIPPNLDTMLGNLQVSFLKEQFLGVNKRVIPPNLVTMFWATYRSAS
jgi:hypothetical protein